MIKFEHPTNGRYYYLVQQKDLFNDTILIVIRGGHSCNVRRCIAYNDRQSIEKEIERLSKKRIKRGYILVQ